MNEKKQGRGAPKGNQNARKKERKRDYQFFGQRWDEEIGNIIRGYLAEHNLPQKHYLDWCVERDMLTGRDVSLKNKTTNQPKWHERYYQFWGQRWYEEIGAIIKEYLITNGLTPKRYIDRCVERDMLNR